MSSSIKIEDIQYGLVLGSDINTVKEALWMTWRAWYEVYQLELDDKPMWGDGYDGECPCCEYTTNLGDIGCVRCPLVDMWFGYVTRNDCNFEPCLFFNSPYSVWDRHREDDNSDFAIAECGGEHPAKIIADFALDLLKKECYGTKELAGPQKPNEPV